MSGPETRQPNNPSAVPDVELDPPSDVGVEVANETRYAPRTLDSPTPPTVQPTPPTAQPPNPAAMSAQRSPTPAGHPVSTIPGQSLSPELPLGRLRVGEPLGKGGMGVVYRATDPVFGRPLACKALLPKHSHRPDLQARFFTEAKVQALLQHPGIVPVHELGKLPDGRPYFSMKLVEGKDLESLLAKRPDPRHDFSKFLGIFEQICLTMAYAHDKGIIHRDLKPANVMVGAYGEVQVMDWGLAKTLSEGRDRSSPDVTASAHDPTSHEEEQELSLAGEAMGTLGYMAPEQARGEWDSIDQRADVFALGAIFSVILSGSPAFTRLESADGSVLLLEQARRGAVQPAIERLKGCGADQELIDLACRCIAAEPADRPADARAVAMSVADYKERVRDRLRRAELEAEAQRVRAEGERKTRKLQLLLAAAVLAVVVVVGGSYSVLARYRAARLETATEAFSTAFAQGEALAAQAEAESKTDRLAARWEDAASAYQRAADALSQVGSGDLVESRTRLEEPLRRSRERHKTAESDLRLLGRLEKIRGERAESWIGPAQVDAAYVDAFGKEGLDIKAGSRAGSDWLSTRPSQTELMAYLNDWLGFKVEYSLGMAKELGELLTAIDPDRLRGDLRSALVRGDQQMIADLLRREESWRTQPSATLLLLARGTRHLLKDRKNQARILEMAWKDNPDDFWLNYELADSSWDEVSNRHSDPAQAVRHHSAAVAIRPNSFAARSNLGVALYASGKLPEAAAEYRIALRINPELVQARQNLGVILFAQGQFVEAAEEYRQALRINPGLPGVHTNLGAALAALGKQEEAEAEHKAALRLQSESAEAHQNLGSALFEQGKAAEAMIETREALRINPNLVTAHFNLARLLYVQGKVVESIDEFRTAIRIKPDYADAYCNLGNVYEEQGKHAEAETEYRNAIRINPDFSVAHQNLGIALLGQGKFDEAASAYRQAARLAVPGSTLAGQINELIRQIDLKKALRNRLESILAGKERPKDAEDSITLTSLCYDLSRHSDAVKLWREAFRDHPELTADREAQHRYNAACSAALAGADDSKTQPRDPNIQADLRKQAREWLQAELAAWRDEIKRASPQQKMIIAQTLQHWKADSDLAGIRDEAGLTALPEPERAECKALWASVETTLDGLQTH